MPAFSQSVQTIMSVIAMKIIEILDAGSDFFVEEAAPRMQACLGGVLGVVVESPGHLPQVVEEVKMFAHKEGGA